MYFSAAKIRSPVLHPFVSVLLGCLVSNLPRLSPQVDQAFEMHGVGSVVCGTVVQGVVRAGQRLVLGPDDRGGFTPVVVRECQRLHTPVAAVWAGQNAALSLTPEQPQPMRGVFGGGSGSGSGVCEVALGAGAAPLRHTPRRRTSVSSGSKSSAAERRQQQQLPSRGALPPHSCPSRLGRLYNAAPRRNIVEVGTGSVSSGQGDESDGSTRPALPGVGGSGHVRPALHGDGGGVAGLVDDDGGGVAGLVDDDGDPFAGLGIILDEEEDSGGGGGVLGGGSSDDLDDDDDDGGFGGALGLMDGVPRGGAAAAAAGATRGAPHTVEAVAGDRGDWFHECEVAISPPMPSFLSASPSSSGSRKGAVLLDASLVSSGPAVSEFEAVVVLLGGRWPARGLVSGRWPPIRPGNRGAAGGTAAAATSSLSSAAELSAPSSALHFGLVGRSSSGSSGSGGSGTAGHMVVVHCGSVRQSAHVVWMQELEQQGGEQQGVEVGTRRGGVGPGRQGVEAGVGRGGVGPGRRTAKATAEEFDLDASRYCGIRATAAILHHCGGGDPGGQGSGSTPSDVWSSGSSGEEMPGQRAAATTAAQPRLASSGGEDLRGCIVKICIRYFKKCGPGLCVQVLGGSGTGASMSVDPAGATQVHVLCG